MKFPVTKVAWDTSPVDVVWTKVACSTSRADDVWTKVAWDTSPVDVVWTKVACSTSRADVALSSSVDSRGPKALPRNQGDGVDCFGMHNLMLGVL